jgi:DNA sulfur modification protein DndE
MKTSIEHIHLSQTAKEQLIKLKRITGIVQWNILCRWSLLFSLADNSEPTSTKIPANSNLEMTWKTFAGSHADIILAAIQERHHRRKNRSLDISAYFRLHLHRGISALANRKGLHSLHDFCSVAIQAG